ncbi:hypothetical protein L596_029891 [Steinernema carpocapsae]|uniref:Uncharacterized protein n=1 Tax=Steinernema carpocapsae TaxID=34508 RepID=A0A4U5LR52_STECR|nr:hypothetical protein L596_029891 [Steinernema carpocapsae]
MHIRKQKPHSVLSALREVTRNEGTNEITLRGHQQQQQLVLSPPARGRLLPSAFPAPRFPLALKKQLRRRRSCGCCCWRLFFIAFASSGVFATAFVVQMPKTKNKNNALTASASSPRRAVLAVLASASTRPRPQIAIVCFAPNSKMEREACARRSGATSNEEFSTLVFLIKN